jgi:hypothetical protein
MTWGGTVPGKSLQWAYDEITEVNDRSDRLVFIFSDFVLTQLGEETEQNAENYQILQQMLDLGVHICACVSPLARKSIFRPYTKRSLSDMKRLGVYMADTYKPSSFLEDIHDFFSEV